MMMSETLIYNEWIKYYEDKKLKIEFDYVPEIKDIPIFPDMSEEEKNAILKKPYILCKGINVKVTYNDELPIIFYIPSGFQWNGANVPFGFYHLIGSPSNPKFKVASMVHDYICENKKVIGYNRLLSSKIFDGLLAEVGVPKWKRALMFLAVDNFQKFCEGWK